MAKFNNIIDNFPTSSVISKRLSENYEKINKSDIMSRSSQSAVISFMKEFEKYKGKGVSVSKELQEMYINVKRIQKQINDQRAVSGMTNV